MRFQMLGALRIWDGSAWSMLPPGQQRVVMAVLLAEANRVVSIDRLIDELWGDCPPRTALNTIQGYVARLRKAVGEHPASRLLTRDRGYEMVVGPEDVDASVFERLAEAGRKSLADGRTDLAVTQLSKALALWHGPAMADVPEAPTVLAVASRLEYSRLGAMEARISAEIDLGRHALVVDELRRLVEEHPLHERFRAQLMLCLYRCGRRAEALETYRQGRRVLVEELGLEPGSDLRRLEQAILADDQEPASPAGTVETAGTGTATASGTTTVPTTRTAPAQLPASVSAFTGRTAHLRRLDDRLSGGTGSSPAELTICTITGTAGVGKTALAVHWSHRVRDRFPGGQLYVNLRAHAAERPLTPVQALAGFLRALGVPGDDIPGEQDAAAGLYRSLLAGRRMLVLLDNAGDPEQVRPLLPGNPECMVLVTSRDRLDGLVAREGAVRIHLGTLDPAEAQTLLIRLLGPDRMDPSGEGDSAAQSVPGLAALCGHLPLALRVAAAGLTAHPRWTIAGYTARLRGDRLGTLAVQGDPQAAVSAAIDLSYRSLPPDARRLFRLLGLLPGADLTEPAAAALADIGYPEAARLLDRLAAAHLIEEHSPGRFTFHDLLRLFAAGKAAEEDGAADRRAAVERLHDFYLRTVDAAARLLYPSKLRLPLSTWATPPCVAYADPAWDGDLTDEASAWSWLDAELPNLVAAVQHAAEHGPHRAAWLLADFLRGYFNLRMDVVAWRSVAHPGLAAAQASGDPQAQAGAHLGIAMLHWQESRYPQAVEHFTRAEALARDFGWTQGEAAAVGNLGIVFKDMGRLREAAELLRRALDLNRGTGWAPGQANGLGNLGEVYHGLGCLDEALETLTQARDLHRQAADRNGEGDAYRALAAVHLDAGNPAQALELAQLALDLARETGDQQFEVDALNTLATAHHHLGRAQAALDTHRQALELARSAGYRQAVAAALTGLALAGYDAGNPEQAAVHARDALAVARQAESRILEAHGLAALAAIQLGQGEVAHAVGHAEQALAIYTRSEHRLGRARAHLLLHHAFRTIGQDSQARTHQDKADALM